MKTNRIKRFALTSRGLLKKAVRAVSERKKLLKGAAVIIVIAAALVFYSGNGENSVISVNEGVPSYSFAQEQEIKASKAPFAKGDAETEDMIVCDIGGAVSEPGVYSLPAGSRLCDLIDLAGGASQDADLSGINRALILSDGQMIRIPVYGEDPVIIGSSQAYAGESEADAKRPVNINTASSEELQTLPGIGPAIAARIIEYRESFGPFRTTDDLRSVKGIGEKTFEKIKDLICC